MQPQRSYLVCATPRSGSTLVCHALAETGVAGRPEEYFEALRHSGRPRRPEEYFLGVEDPSIRDHLGERAVGSEQAPRSPLWSRAAYDRYLEWAFEAGTTPNGIFGAKLMWGYFGDFVSLLRNVPAYRDVPLAELLPSAFPDLTFVRVVRANKVRQAVSLWKAVQTATWREDQASAKAASVEGDGSPPYRSFIEEHRPQLRFHYRAIAHLLEQILVEESCWDAFFEHSGIKPVLVLYENFAADYETSTLRLLERLDLSPPPDFDFEPRMKRQSDQVNDDWVRRYSELRLGTDFDLVPVSTGEHAQGGRPGLGWEGRADLLTRLTGWIGGGRPRNARRPAAQNVWRTTRPSHPSPVPRFRKLPSLGSLRHLESVPPPEAGPPWERW